jgi:hypothetical protein
VAVQVESTAAIARVAAGLIALGAATAVIAAAAAGSLEQRRRGWWPVRSTGERAAEDSGGPALADETGLAVGRCETRVTVVPRGRGGDFPSHRTRAKEGERPAESRPEHGAARALRTDMPRQTIEVSGIHVPWFPSYYWRRDDLREYIVVPVIRDPSLISNLSA